jgi:hypothetical protein
MEYKNSIVCVRVCADVEKRYYCLILGAASHHSNA